MSDKTMPYNQAAAMREAQAALNWRRRMPNPETTKPIRPIELAMLEATPMQGDVPADVIVCRRICSCGETTPHYHAQSEIVFGCWPDQRAGMGAEV